MTFLLDHTFSDILAEASGGKWKKTMVSTIVLLLIF